MPTTKPRRTLSKTIKYFLYRVFILILTIPSIFITTPLVLSIVLPFALYRKSLSCLAPIFNPSLGKILTTGSSIFAADNFYEEKSTTISNSNVVRGRVDYQKFCEEFTQKALNRRDPTTHELVYPEFRQNVVRWMGYAFWKDVPNFSLSDCIISYEDSQKIDYLQGEWNASNALQRLIAVHNSPWDPEKPLWRLIFLPYKCQKDASSCEDTLFIILVHHSLADGFSGMKAFFPCMGIDPKEFLGRINTTKNSTSALNLVSGISWAFSAHYDCLYTLIKSFDSSNWKADSKLMTNSDYTTYGASSDPFPLQRLKDTKDKYGVSLTAVVLAMFAAGLRRGLLETICKESSAKLPKKIHLMLPLPVPGHPDKLRNHLALGVVSLPVGDPDSVSRLHRIHRGFERLKKSPSLVTGIHLQKLMGAFPIRIVNVLRRVDNVTAVMTNLPGPPYPMSITGLPVEDSFLCGNANFGSVGAGASFTTYNGTARLTVGGFETVFTSQQVADNVLAASLKEIDVLQSIDEV